MQCLVFYERTSPLNGLPNGTPPLNELPNGEVRAKIQQAIGPHEDLTIVSHHLIYLAVEPSSVITSTYESSVRIISSTSKTSTMSS